MGEMTFPLWTAHLSFAHFRHELKEEIGNQASISSQELWSPLPPPQPPLCSGFRGLSQAKPPSLQLPNKHNRMSLSGKSTLIIHLQLS